MLLRRRPVEAACRLGLSVLGVWGRRFSLPTLGIIDLRPRGGRALEADGPLIGSIDFLRLPWLTLTLPSVWRRDLDVGRGGMVVELYNESINQININFFLNFSVLNFFPLHCKGVARAVNGLREIARKIEKTCNSFLICAYFLTFIH